MRTADSLNLTMLGKLDLLLRELNQLKTDQYESIEKMHLRITSEKAEAHRELWAAIHRNDKRLDDGRMWLIGALTTALIALLGSLISFIGLVTVGHVGTPH